MASSPRVPSLVMPVVPSDCPPPRRPAQFREAGRRVGNVGTPLSLRSTTSRMLRTMIKTISSVLLTEKGTPREPARNASLAKTRDLKGGRHETNTEAD